MGALDLVVVGTCRDAVEAEIKKSALEQEDIYCAIENEGQAGLTGTFDIKLLVPRNCKEKAIEFLSTHEV
ncbi:MAG: hypothetical protein COA78_27495 [Blastopirellula sp.]|nr:MAG: hypothetical protein COA78_27495 [Blastopirellula sp.]